MFLVNDTHAVIAPPLSGYYAAKKALHEAGFRTQEQDRHALPAERSSCECPCHNPEINMLHFQPCCFPDRTVVAIIPPWFTWLESMWAYCIMTGTWLGPDSELSDIASKSEWFSDMIEKMDLGCVERSWLPILQAADILVSSVGLCAALSRAFGKKVPRTTRERPECLREHRRGSSWPPLKLQAITNAEKRIGDLAGGAWRKEKGSWPAELTEIM